MRISVHDNYSADAEEYLENGRTIPVTKVQSFSTYYESLSEIDPGDPSYLESDKVEVNSEGFVLVTIENGNNEDYTIRTIIYNFYDKDADTDIVLTWGADSEGFLVPAKGTLLLGYNAAGAYKALLKEKQESSGGGGGGSGHPEATDSDMDYDNPSENYLVMTPKQVKAMIDEAIQDKSLVGWTTVDSTGGN